MHSFSSKKTKSKLLNKFTPIIMIQVLKSLGKINRKICFAFFQHACYEFQDLFPHQPCQQLLEKQNTQDYDFLEPEGIAVVTCWRINCFLKVEKLKKLSFAGRKFVVESCSYSLYQYDIYHFPLALAVAEKLFSCENSQDQNDFCLFAVFICLLFAEMFQCENCHAAGSASCLSVLILPKLQLASVRGRSNILSSTRKDPIPPQLLLVFSYTPPYPSSLEVFVALSLHCHCRSRL